MSYPPLTNRWFLPHLDDFKMECCDCGLVHRLRFRVLPGRHRLVLMRVTRDGRATGQIRRHRGLTIPQLFKELARLERQVRQMRSRTKHAKRTRKKVLTAVRASR